MFGFGDDQNPYTESVDLLEDLVIEYITETVTQFHLFVLCIIDSSRDCVKQHVKCIYYLITATFFN